MTVDELKVTGRAHGHVSALRYKNMKYILAIYPRKQVSVSPKLSSLHQIAVGFLKGIGAVVSPALLWLSYCRIIKLINQRVGLLRLFLGYDSYAQTTIIYSVCGRMWWNLPFTRCLHVTDEDGKKYDNDKHTHTHVCTDEPSYTCT